MGRSPWLVLLLASACSAPGTRSPTPAASASAPAVAHRGAPVLTAAPSAPGAPPPASTVKGVTIPPLPDVGCEVHGTRWSGSLSLREGLPFASAFESPATITLSDPPMANVTVEATLRVQALVERPSVYASAPTTLGGFVVPEPRTALGWARVRTSDTVPVSIDTADLFSEPVVVAADVGCGALAIDTPSYDARAFVSAKRGQEVGIDGGAEVSSTPGGAVVAKLRPEGSAVAELLESRGAWRKVMMEGAGYLAVGWVAAKFVGVPGLRGIPYGTGSGRLAGHYGHIPTCVHELPVFALVAGERAHVGALRAGAGYRKLSKAPPLDAGWVAIELVDSTVSPVEGALLLVWGEDLQDCSGPPQ